VPPFDGFVPPRDGFVPPFDGFVPPFDGFVPPFDGFVPPFDGFVPPFDGFVPPDITPPMDARPDTGCNPSCADLCGLVSTCGLGIPNCTAACPGWDKATFNCASNIYCSPKAFIDCVGLKTCLSPPPQQPDLRVTGLKASVAGSTVTYSAIICNGGSTATGTYFVDLYYNRSAPPQTSQFGDAFKQQSSLGPGVCTPVSFTRTNTSPGAYRSWIQLDADTQVTESDETNNVDGPITVTVTAPPRGPDLTIRSIDVRLYGTTTTTVSYSIRICNDGSQRSSNTQVHVYYNLTRPPVTGQTGDTFTTLTALDAGACITRTISRSGTPLGTYQSYAQVDPLDAVAEAREDNNIFGPKAVVVGSSPGSDLRIESFTATPSGSNSVRYRARVCNRGTGASGSTTVSVYYNRPSAPTASDPGDQLTSVPILQPGSCTDRSIYRSGTPPGTYISWAYVDRPNVVTETREDNNIAGPVTVSVTLPQLRPDLRFSAFTVSTNGSTVTYSIRVCNFGNGPAGPTQVDLYFNRPSTPPSGLSGDRVLFVTSLAQGSCRTLPVTRSSTPPGSYRSYVRVDRLNQVQESNESNNTRGPVYALVTSNSLTCNQICITAITCGIFSPTDFSQCSIWCSNLSSTQKSCADNAVRTNNCSALRTCAPIPPPPPPPPPQTCQSLCTWLDKTCRLLPSGGSALCLQVCAGLTPTQLQCAQTAQQQGQCSQALGCVF
jgi:subtilase family serine protease